MPCLESFDGVGSASLGDPFTGDILTASAANFASRYIRCLWLPRLSRSDGAGAVLFLTTVSDFASARLASFLKLQWRQVAKPASPRRPHILPESHASNVATLRSPLRDRFITTASLFQGLLSSHPCFGRRVGSYRPMWCSLTPMSPRRAAGPPGLAPAEFQKHARREHVPARSQILSADKPLLVTREKLELGGPEESSLTIPPASIVESVVCGPPACLDRTRVRHAPQNACRADPRRQRTACEPMPAVRTGHHRPDTVLHLGRAGAEGLESTGRTRTRPTNPKNGVQIQDRQSQRMGSITSTCWQNTFQRVLPVVSPPRRGILSRARFVEDAISSFFIQPHLRLQSYKLPFARCGGSGTLFGSIQPRQAGSACGSH